MQRRFARTLLGIVAAACIAATAALAQESGEKSAFVALLEDLISTPDRQISITGFEGAFSANPTMERLALSDREGVWLELQGVEVTWNRAALLDRTLHIESLKARRVAILRRPSAPAESGSDGGSSPGLPIAITIDAISLPQISLAAPVAGAEAELAAAGSAQLTEQALAAQLSVFRQDRAGTLTAELRLEPDANVLTADLTLEEPPGGLIAELLDLPDRPAISARLSGTGPLDSWDAKLEAEAGGEKVLDGSMAISRMEAGHRLVAEMTASLEGLAPADYAALVAGESLLTLDVTRSGDGAVTIETASLRSGGMDMRGSGVLASDLVPQSARLSLRLGQAGRAALPFVAGEISVASLQVDAEVEEGAASPWRVGVAAEEVEGTFGSLGRIAVNASGEARNLVRPSARSVSFLVNGALEGLAPSDPALRAATGPELRLAAEGSWSAGQPVGIANLQLVLNDAAASFAGTATAEAIDGSFGMTVSDLSRFAALAGRTLAGSAQIKASGSATKDGRFDLDLDGNTVDLRLGIVALDPWLAGATNLAGGIARSDAGVSFDDLVLANDRMNTEINGAVTDPTLDLAVSADVADLSLLTERAAGRAHISARLTGTSAAPHVEAEAAGEEVVLMGRPLAGASAHFSGVVAGPETAGDAQLTGTLAGAPVSGTARLSAAEGGARRIDGLNFTVGGSRVSGDLTIGADGLLSGNVNLVSPDLSKVAPLLLVEAGGMLRAEVRLAAENGSQSADISATAADVVYENVTLETAEIEGRARDLFTAPQIEGDFSLRNVKAGGLSIVSATGTAERRGAATVLTAEAELADGSATLDASLEPREGGLGIGLSRFTFARSGVDLVLASPTTIVFADGAAAFDNAALNAGGGSATISGRAGETLDLAVDLAGVPAALVNSFSPQLGAEGAISGNIAVAGPAAAPVAQFEVAVAGASVAASRNAGLGPLQVAFEGDLAEGRVRLASQISGADGFAVNVNGTVGAAEGAPLDLKIAGVVPLSLGNPRLAARGAALQGALSVDMAVSGTASAPQFSGRVTSEGGGFVDPESGIVLSNLSLTASVSNNELVIDRLNAASGEGTVAAEGSLGLDPNVGLPVDMRIGVRNARYVDGTLIAATFDADLTLSGRLTEGPGLAGEVRLDRTEITVPERLPGDSVAVSVEHVVPPPPVERTLEIMRERDRQSRAGGGGRGGVALDVAVQAPRRIFVRGRGLDAELGGRLQLVGSTSSIVASGSFELIRGRLDILTQRIVLDRGIITFAGDLDPILDFVGSTRSGEVTITVTVSGRASDPEVIFSSIPQLPQDEILAQLIFQKGIGELSPLQIARLGAAASELTGGGGGLLSQLRATTGLDAELGGRLQLLGSTASVVASGAFELIRGRLDILTQRIVLDRGIITFAGDLDPILDFIGTTRSGDVTITVTVSGRASDPEVIFSSVPELPQDEILAQLIFQKGIGELSPLQIARLAAAASELTGGGGGVLGQLRASTGLDDLDIVVDEEGQAALAAGRYIGENVYLGVEQGATTESSRVTIDLDIT